MKSRKDAVPLISFDTKLRVEPEAIEYLKSYNCKIGVVAVCGKYRTGKSYLLNRIFNRSRESSQQFEVGQTINSCTKGLWMMKEPVYVQETYNPTNPELEWCNKDDEGAYPVFIIDTEGLGAIDEDSNHDSNIIFLLAILLSSLLIFNS